MKKTYCDHHELVVFPDDFKEKKIYQICSDLYVSERKIGELITCFNKAYMSGAWSLEQLETQIWKVFWVNPFIAVKMFESCCLYETVNLYGALKSVWYGLFDPDRMGRQSSPDQYIQVDKLQFTVLMIVVCFSTIVQSDGDNRHVIDAMLKYAYGLYSKAGGACFSARNLYFIYYHIPNQYKIKFLNWFCKKYKYEASAKRVNKYGKKTTDKPLRCIKTIVEETKTDCLWKYFSDENGDEYAEVVQILREEHEDFLFSILGGDDMEKKIERIEAYAG